MKRIKQVIVVVGIVLCICFPSIVFANTEAPDYIAGVRDGNGQGVEQGAIYGQEAARKEKKNLWSADIPNNARIRKTYNLERETNEYGLGFIKGFMESFEKSYKDAYRKTNLELIQTQTETFTELTMRAGKLASSDGVLQLEIEEGTLFLQNYLAAERVKDIKEIPKTCKMHSYPYHIKIGNTGGTIFPEKPMKLVFEYYGNQKAGIYEYKNNRWIYLHTLKEDTLLYTMIDQKTYKGGTYIVLVDTALQKFNDLEAHWAEEEIETFLWNRYINGYANGTFQPDHIVTRGEFVMILDQIKGWDKQTEIDIMKIFEDYSVIGASQKHALAYAVEKGYIKGYGDQTIRPDMPISYIEMEHIMKRVLNNPHFKWETTAQKMMEKKGIISKSFESKKQWVTRAEIIYMLSLNL